PGRVTRGAFGSSSSLPLRHRDSREGRQLEAPEGVFRDHGDRNRALTERIAQLGAQAQPIQLEGRARADERIDRQGEPLAGVLRGTQAYAARAAQARVDEGIDEGSGSE